MLKILMVDVVMNIKGHTGDLFLAMPLINELKEQGYKVGAYMDEVYYAPIKNYIDLPLITDTSLNTKWCKLNYKKGHITDAWSKTLRREGLPHTPRKLPKVEGKGVLLQPWCEDRNKMFPVIIWRSIVEAINEPLQVAGPSCYKEEANLIVEGFNHATNICGIDKDTWVGTIKSKNKVITVDSGAGHVADHFGKDVLVLFKSTDPAVWAPAFSRDNYVRSSSTPDIILGVEKLMKGAE